MNHEHSIKTMISYSSCYLILLSSDKGLRYYFGSDISICIHHFAI